MEDRKIIELYFARNENAIAETAAKYGKYCHYIAYNILYSEEDAEECVNDTYVQAWGVIPPKNPEKFSVFLGKITRNIAINRYRRDHAKKRNGASAVFEEADSIGTLCTTSDTAVEELALRQAIDSFVYALPSETRIIFVRRYWYMSRVQDIAKDYGIPQGTVKSILSRTRKKFREHLLKEGFII